jgi:hypothetical protein
VPGGAQNSNFLLVQNAVFESCAHTKETRGAKWDEIEKWSGFGEKTNIMMAVFAF